MLVAGGDNERPTPKAPVVRIVIFLKIDELREHVTSSSDLPRERQIGNEEVITKAPPAFAGGAFLFQVSEGRKVLILIKTLHHLHINVHTRRQ